MFTLLKLRGVRSAKSLKIDSLDLENPRMNLASDQRDAMQKIIPTTRFSSIEGFDIWGSRIHFGEPCRKPVGLARDYDER